MHSQPGTNDLTSLKKGYSLHIHGMIFQVLRIGSLRNSHNSAYLPEKAVSVHLKGCHHVELFARTFNHVAQSLRNLTIVDSTTAVMHKRLFESRHQQNSGSNGHSLQMSSISISQVQLKLPSFSVTDSAVAS